MRSYKTYRNSVRESETEYTKAKKELSYLTEELDRRQRMNKARPIHFLKNEIQKQRTYIKTL